MKRSSDDNFFVENNRRFFKFIEELAKRGFVELKEGEDHSTYPYSFYITGIYSKYAKINIFMRSLDEVGKYFGNSEVTRKNVRKAKRNFIKKKLKKVHRNGKYELA